MRFRKSAWRDQPNHPVFVVTAVVLIAFTAWFFWWSFIGDDDEPSTPRSAETTQPSAPTRSSEEPPPFPDAARQPTEAGLEAAVRYENDAINYAQRTGDTEPLQQVYDLEKCEFCASLVAQFENLTSNDRYLVGASYAVVSVIRTDISSQGRGQYTGVVEFSNKRESGQQLEPDGRVIREIEASPTSIFERTLSFDSGAWRIVGNRLVEAGR